MQLFITDYQKKEQTLIINDAMILSQVRKVLRARIGDSIWVQSPERTPDMVRYEIRIDARDESTLRGTIRSEQHHESSPATHTMIIAMPNKRDKVELIVQKLTECGLDQIVFRPSERSVIKEWNTKKEERLHKIITEATEQSRGRIVPELRFINDISPYLKGSQVIVFDKETMLQDRQATHTGISATLPSSSITGIVGPEGGLTPKDHQQFQPFAPKVIPLGSTVLRTETAAIIGGRLIKNEHSIRTV